MTMPPENWQMGLFRLIDAACIPYNSEEGGVRPGARFIQTICSLQIRRRAGPSQLRRHLRADWKPMRNATVTTIGPLAPSPSLPAVPAGLNLFTLAFTRNVMDNDLIEVMGNLNDPQRGGSTPELISGGAEGNLQGIEGIPESCKESL